MADTTSPIPLFVADLPTIPTPISQLLEKYSGVPSAGQKAHIIALRDRAYAHYPYPCLGRFRFLELDLSAHPLYSSVVLPLFSRRSEDPNGPVYLDLGCCLGQDLRKLLLDASQNLPPPSSLTQRVYGADLRPEFINIGYKLFKDDDTLPRSQFVTPADVLDDSAKSVLSILDGKVNVLHSTAVFHLFDWEKQKQMARRCLKLLNRAGEEGDLGGKRALILGSQIGNINPRDVTRRDGITRFRHDGNSWRKLWEEVVKEEHWKDVVKSVEVESRMEGRSESSKQRDQDAVPAKRGFLFGMLRDNKNFIGMIEEGFRWHVWWVYVDFY